MSAEKISAYTNWTGVSLCASVGGRRSASAQRCAVLAAEFGIGRQFRGAVLAQVALDLVVCLLQSPGAGLFLLELVGVLVAEEVGGFALGTRPSVAADR